MTIKRESKIYLEGHRRLLLWLKNESFDEMTCSGSMLTFQMSLGLYGHPFEKPQWMKKEKFNKFITHEEFNNPKYITIINALFREAELINKKSNKEYEKK